MTTFISKQMKFKWIIGLILAVLIVPVTGFSEETLTATPTVTYGADGLIEVINIVEYTGKIFAIGASVDLPENVEFVSATGDFQPAIMPKKGDTGLLEFAWVMPPTSPFRLTYTVKAFPEASADIYSQISYRRTGGALYEKMNPIKVKP
ncbi:conserved hypothetical protein, secreted [Candidatus Magnetomorum sp. HK-1]|nr:conserved hypothetical protein, secreted [Candidatus Magnetomorum sp. HK-1]